PQVQASRNGEPHNEVYSPSVTTRDLLGDRTTFETSGPRDDPPCIYNLTNSNGNAAIPLSSYGLNVTEQGDIRSICAPGSPCLEFNALFGGRLEEIFTECGCLDKFLRVVAETPLLQLIADANPCQESGEPACLIETTCAGTGP